MALLLLKLRIRGRWRMLCGNCPGCNGRGFQPYGCWVCVAGQILPRFRWARFQECINP